MAELRIKAFRLPESEAERDMVLSGLTNKQAEQSAPLVRYWIDQAEDLVIMVVPVLDADP